MNHETLCNKIHGGGGSQGDYIPLTGYEPKNMIINEVVDSQDPFSYGAQSSDLDIDDAALGKLLAEVHRESTDYRHAEGMIVSQSSMSIVSEGSGQPDGRKSNFSQPISLTFTVLSFLKFPKLKKRVIAQGNLRSETAQLHRLGLVLMNRDK